jgi:hypothetical protein
MGSAVPLGAVVGIDRLEVVPTQPPKNKKENNSDMSLVCIVPPREDLTLMDEWAGGT